MEADRATRPVHLPLLRISSQLLRSDQNLVMMVMVFLRIMVMSTTNVQSSVCQLGKGANKKIRKKSGLLLNRSILGNKGTLLGGNYHFLVINDHL